MLDMDSEEHRKVLVRWLGNGLLGKWGQIPPKVRKDIIEFVAAQLDVPTGAVELAVAELGKMSKAPKAPRSFGMGAK